MAEYTSRQSKHTLPRIPLEGDLDITYRCNNVCRHCWLWLAKDAPEGAQELTFAEICGIADQARALGTRRWHISGGEPMLRPDFAEIFDYLSRKSTGISLNTNGTLITPEIAQLLKRTRATTAISLYGATAEVYDAVTRHPGGFEAAMRGMQVLREAGAEFIVQLMPMQENWQQWPEMLALAATLSPQQRLGGSWLFLSADGSPARNRQIAGQRLSPRAVVELDRPRAANIERMAELENLLEAEPFGCGSVAPGDDRLFARCIARRRNFHIDPYGMVSWCSFIKDPALRYDLRRGTLREAWDEFIPSCADQVRGGPEWRENCGACDKHADCRWCAVFAHLETGRYDARIPYLCDVTAEARRYKEDWQTNHQRYFKIAGITVRLESDLSFVGIEIKPELAAFAVSGPGDDNVILQHHFELPNLEGRDLGEEHYRKAPWIISRQPKTGTWCYRGIGLEETNPSVHCVATFTADHRHGTLYNRPTEVETVRTQGWHSLSLFPTDQIWLAPLLADRQAVLVHSAAARVNGQGLVFVGHSTAGKSTTMEMLKSAARSAAPLQAEVLCDDRNVLRKWTDGWRVHGTWSHGTTADVSNAEAPLRALLFLSQANRNEIVPMTDPKQIWRLLLATLIRSVVTAEWWQKELDVLEQLVKEVNCYTMYFDKSGKIVAQLARLTQV